MCIDLIKKKTLEGTKFGDAHEGQSYPQPDPVTFIIYF